MPCTTYCKYIPYTQDKDINELLDSVRYYFKNPEQIFVDETIKYTSSIFRKTKTTPMYHIHWLVSYSEYQVMNLNGGLDKEHILAYLYGLLNGLMTFTVPMKRKCLKENLNDSN